MTLTDGEGLGSWNWWKEGGGDHGPDGNSGVGIGTDGNRGVGIRTDGKRGVWIMELMERE